MAVFACGLRDDARIKLRAADMKVPLDTALLMGILDTLNLNLWAKTQDGQKGINCPKSMSAMIFPSNEQTKGYSSSDDFNQARQLILEKLKEGGDENGD